VVLGSLEEALEYARSAGESEVFVIGGGQIYKEAFASNVVQRLYLTLVHADIAGDTHFPLVDPSEWREVSREYHPPDGSHVHGFSFLVLER
jgi:dihydrofolate reductase